MRKAFSILAVAASLWLAQVAAAAPGESEAPAPKAEIKVNINTDDAATLAERLDGVGLKRAEAIIAYREANGAFRDAEELANVKGIGERTVAANADRIEVEVQ